MSKDGQSGNGKTDEEFLVDVIFSHKLAWVRGLLKEQSLPSSGTEAELRNRIKEYLEAGTLSSGDLIGLLDEVEGWGDQHAYLYSASTALIAELADETEFKKALKKNRALGLFNEPLPLVLPDAPKLSSVDWSTDAVRFVWVEKREYRDRIEDEDREEDDLVFDAYKIKVTRGVISFQCDLVTGHAELLIQRLPTGNNYLAEKAKYETRLGKFFDMAQLTPCTVGGAIKKIDSATGIRKRASELATTRGHRITYTSRSRKEDVYNDPDILKSRKTLGALLAGRLGNYYWPIDGRDIHLKLYAKDQRLGIFGECTQEEVSSVLAQIRGYC
jgi:hypothetical protein